MTFASMTFWAFLPVVFALYWLAKRRAAQNMVLIVASYIFYGWWDYRFCALILISSLVDFWIGAALSKTDRAGVRRAWLWCSIVCNLGMLGVFKYHGFFLENARLLAESLGWHLSYGALEVVLPAGISFYTFQTLSYTRC